MVFFLGNFGDDRGSWSAEFCNKVRPCCGHGRMAGNRGRPWEACNTRPCEQDSEIQAEEARVRGVRGGATQRAYELADRHALLFRSRRRAAGNPCLAILTPHKLLRPTFLLVRLLNARRELQFREGSIIMDDWERHVTPLLQDMGCANEDAQDDFFNQQDLISRRVSNYFCFAIKRNVRNRNNTARY
ncbi:unnamed protein product [Arctia plantaginis]|uniref:Uncharacterized protein n=1 Tax=Arctia plantaginis TaxID=874455 RepID=A0A8S0YZQ5_ARCPL|nr:unnamed protein product [Arctia plantaginis]